MAVNKAKALKLADKYIAKQNYSKALNELLKVLKLTPNDSNLLNKIGDLYTKLGKTENAISYFLKVAESYHKSGFNLKAIALYKKIIRIDDKYMDARHKLVELYMQQGYHSETKGELRRMAEHYYQENLLSRARDCYQQIVDLDPSNLDARIKITEILVREGMREEACDHFVAMGRDLLDKTMVNEAKKIISQGLKVMPDHSGLLILSCRCNLAEGKADEALEQLSQIVSNDPSNRDAMMLLGETYLDRNQLGEAKDLYLRVFERDGEHTEPLENVARQLIEANRLDEAFDCLMPVGERFITNKDFEEATRLFRGILYADEDHIPSQEMLIRIYRESSQTANALLALEKVIHHYMEKGDEDSAVARIQQLLELDPNNQEWRDKLQELGTNSSVADLEEDEIHVFDEQSLSGKVLDEGSMDIDLNNHSVSEEAADGATAVANHITEAGVFIKYGMIDKAVHHLEAAKDIDFLHMEVNARLKELYLQKGETNKAIACMVSMVNACLEVQNFQQARTILDEIAQYNPEIAEIHRGRISSIAGEPEPVTGNAPSDGFDLDFAEVAEIVEESGGLMLGDADDQDVVDFKHLNQGKESIDVPDPSDDGWSLDMPSDGAGRAEDFADLYDPAKESEGGASALPSLQDIGDDSRFDLTPLQGGTGFDDPVSGDGADALPDLDQLADDSRLDLSLPEELAQQETEDQALPASEASEPLLDLDSSVGEPLPPKEAAREPSHAPLGTSQGGSLASELEEIDFFISVEAFEDARNLIEDARKTFGDHPFLMERVYEVESKTQSADMAPPPSAGSPATPASPAEPIDKEGGFFDLAAELSEELFEEEGQGEVNDATSQEEIQSVEELFEEFKKGVDEQIDEEDHETHYDLGIAYKEMGLLDEAISEFEKASRDRSRFLECAIMIGNCNIELGHVEKAIDHYETNLAVEGLSAEVDLALRYELALAFQRCGELEKAVDHLRTIQGGDPDYRDVNELIEALI